MFSKKIFFTFFILFYVFLCSAQSWKFEKKISIDQTDQISTDNYGNLYISDFQGNIFQYDSALRLQNQYSPAQFAKVSLLDARQTLRIFAFYRDLQTFSLLNRFLSPIENLRIEDNELGFIRMATPSLDNQVWLFDDLDFSVKKYNPNLSKISIKIALDLLLPISSDYDFNFMTEYQNILFVNEANFGIVLFDNLGNYLEKIDTGGNPPFYFWENELYFLKNDSIKIIDFYKLDNKTLLIPAELSQKIKTAIRWNQHFYFIGEKEIYCYGF